jgi:DNA-binding beta-propeller fold protein YncE
VPGASQLGDLLDLGLDIRSLVASPRQGYALATSGENRTVIELKEADGKPAARELPGVAPGPDRIVMSPRGTAAAFYYADANKVHIISGLPDRPAAVFSVDLPVSGSFAGAMAVSDDGVAVLIAPAEGMAGGVFRATPGEPLRLVWSFRRAAAMDFLPLSHDALVADGEENALYLLRDTGESAQAVWLAGEQDGISGPRSVAAADDGSRAVVASGLSRSLVVVDLAGGPPLKLACDCAPAELSRLQGNAVFRLTGFSSERLWVLDADGPEPRLVFVSPPPEVASVSPRPEAVERGQEQ